MRNNILFPALGISMILCGGLQLSAQAVAITPSAFTNLNVERHHKSMKKIDKEELLELTNAVAADAGVTGPLADAAAPLLKSVAEAEYQFQLGNTKAVHEDASFIP